MSEDGTSQTLQARLRSFLERHWLLIAIIALSIIVRSIPGWIHPGWGNDFGIYYGLTKQFAENPQWFQPYDGWGDSYQYFPMLYLITADAQGVDI